MQVKKCFYVLALSGFVAEAVLVVAAGQTGRCGGRVENMSTCTFVCLVCVCVAETCGSARPTGTLHEAATGAVAKRITGQPALSFNTVSLQHKRGQNKAFFLPLTVGQKFPLSGLWPPSSPYSNFYSSLLLFFLTQI